MSQLHVPQTTGNAEPLPSAAPSASVPVDGSARDRPFAERPESLVELLAASVQKHAGRSLFASKHDGRWVETTYRDFGERVDALRAALSALGVGAGDRVGIIACNRVEWAVAAYATYGLRAAFVPMYEAQHESEWAFIIRDSGLKLLFVTDQALRTRVERIRTSTPTLEHVVVLSETDAEPTYASLVKRGAAAPVAVSRPFPTDIATVLYTSGTTGEPKGVLLSHGNVLANLLTLREVMAAAEEHPEEQRSLAFLPWAHAFGHTSELHAAISTGSSMAIAESIDKIVDNLQEIRPTILVAVPRVFLRVYNNALHLIGRKPAPVRWLFERGLEAAKKKNRGERLRLMEAVVLAVANRIVFARVRARLGGRLKYAVSGAAALSRDVGEFIDAIGIVVYEGYGLTETSPIATANVPGQRKLGSVGRPIPGVRIEIDRTSASDARHGEIIIYGPNVMQGYENRPADTQAVFTPDGGFRTGDMGYLDDDGYLFITGRIKEQYKLANGKYVVPTPLEERLKVSPFIANVMVYGENRTHNVALIVPDLAVLREWAEEAGLAVSDTRALLADQRVRTKLGLELDRLSGEFRGYERIKAFALLSEDFTQENRLLTPSLKLKRENVIERFRDELTELYADAVDLAH
jgi:long-chain acyl-CoA synthetase